MKATGIALLVVVALTVTGCFNMGDVNVPEIPKIPEPPYIDSDDAGDSSGPAAFPDLGQASPAAELGAENGVLFFAYDVMTYPGETTSLPVRIRDARTFSGITGVKVAYTKTSGRTGETETIGTAVTDRTGQAVLRVSQDREANYTFGVRVSAVPAGVSDDVLNVTPTRLLMVSRSVNTKFVAVSVDGSLVGTSLGSLLAGEDAPVLPGSSDLLNRLAGERKFTVLYIVSRPEQGNGRLKRWLMEHDFPIGPVLAIDLAGADHLPGLPALRQYYPGVMIGVAGDIETAREYLANAMTTFLIPRYDPDPEKMRKLANKIEELPDSQQLNVVSSWKEIEMAVFYNVRLRPETFAKRLEALADEIEEQQKLDRRREDEDD